MGATGGPTANLSNTADKNNFHCIIDIYMKQHLDSHLQIIQTGFIAHSHFLWLRNKFYLIENTNIDIRINMLVGMEKRLQGRECSVESLEEIRLWTGRDRGPDSPLTQLSIESRGREREQGAIRFQLKELTWALPYFNKDRQAILLYWVTVLKIMMCCYCWPGRIWWTGCGVRRRCRREGSGSPGPGWWWWGRGSGGAASYCHAPPSRPPSLRWGSGRPVPLRWTAGNGAACGPGPHLP